MAYFSNSTDGLAFESKWCDHCIHAPKTDSGSCPVLLAHLLYQGQTYRKDVLDILISNGPEGPECEMYFEMPGQTPWED